MGPNYLLVCYFLWESAFPIAGNKTSDFNEFTTEHSLDLISERLKSGNRAMEKAERHTLFGNSTENITQWQAEYKTEPHNSSMKVPQDSIQIVINSTSIKMIKENNQTELNLVSNSSDKSSNKSTKIEFTTMEDRNTTNTKTSLVSTSSIIVTEDPQIQPIAQTGSYNTSTYDSTTNAYNDKTILSGKNGHKHILTHKLRHKILKHLNLGTYYLNMNFPNYRLEEVIHIHL